MALGKALASLSLRVILFIRGVGSGDPVQAREPSSVLGMRSHTCFHLLIFSLPLFLVCVVPEALGCNLERGKKGKGGLGWSKRVFLVHSLLQDVCGYGQLSSNRLGDFHKVQSCLWKKVGDIELQDLSLPEQEGGS